MPVSITCSAKILTFAIATFLFILVGIPCEFVMVPGVYILLPPQEVEVHSSCWVHRCIHSAAHSSKRFKLCLPLHYYAKVLVELEKKYRKWIQVRYGYVYQTNLLLENFLKISLKSFESFWLYIWVLVIWLLIVRQMVLRHMLPPMPMYKKTCVQKPPNVF